MNSFSQSKLKEVLSSLTRRHRKDLIHFIRMPSLRLKEHEIRMMIYFIQKMDNRELEQVDKEVILTEFQSEKALLSENWKYILGNLLNALYHFNAYKKGAIFEMPSALPLLKHFREKRLQKNQKTFIKSVFKSLYKSKERDNYFHLYEFQLLRLKVEDSRHQRKDIDSFRQYVEALDYFYLENRLRIICELINRSEIINLKENYSDLEIWEKRYDLNNHLSISIKLFYKVYTMLTDISNGEFHFSELKKLLSQDTVSQFSKNDIKTIYENMSNFCIYCLNKGEEKWSREYIALIDSQKDENVLLDNGLMTPQKYKNSVTAGLISGKVEWVENFVEKYYDNLMEKRKDSIHQYNLANIEFHKGNFQASLEKLSFFHPFDFYYHISYEKLMLKIYFELSLKNEKLNYSDAISNRINSFTSFIKNKATLTTKNKKPLLSFIHFYKKIFKGNPIKFEELIGKIPTLDLIWFKKKLGDNNPVTTLK